MEEAAHEDALAGDAGPGGNPHSLFAQLGLRHEFRPDGEAPPVRIDLLKQLVRNELPDEKSTEVYRLITKYRSWHRAYVEAMAQQENYAELRAD